MPGRIRLLLLLAASGVLGSLHPRISAGCQYNVRETGFVDLGTERYFVFYYVTRNTPRAEVTVFEKAAEEAFHDSNVVSQVIRADRTDEHPALKYLDRSLLPSLPGAVVVSPEEMTRVLAMPKKGEPLRPALLREVVDSPLRQRIVQRLARTYGIVLFIEGPDAEANRKACVAAEAAIKAVERQMRFMPKPIARGPSLLTLEYGSRDREDMLLWSLGLGPGSPVAPCAAVLYGRARRIGPLLKGDEITEQVLYNILAVVGADCECGIDPRLIRGTALPAQWNRDAQAAVAAELGYDPDNPVVVAEVSQIMRMRALLYPWAGERERSAPSAYDLKVPFVEDSAPGRSTAADSPIWVNLIYAVGAASGAVLIVGLVIFLRSARRKA